MPGLRVLPLSRLPLGARLLKMGDRGEDVAELQQLLAREGYYPNEPDGIFGVVTDEAVRRCQAANRVRVDGIVGPVLLAALENRFSQTRPTYRVTSEPDLKAVAQKLGMSAAAIARANHMQEQAQTYPGQCLLINRRVLGLWADGPGRAAPALPPVSFTAYSAAELKHDGRLEWRLGRAADWARAHPVPSWPVVLTSPDSVKRLLKRPEWWPDLWSDIWAPAGEGRAIIDIGTPGISDRRRWLRMLGRARRLRETGRGRLMLIFRLPAAGRIPAAWLRCVAAHVDGIIVYADVLRQSSDELRRILKPLQPALPPGRFLLGASLAAEEKALDDAGNVIETASVPYYEAQWRASLDRDSTRASALKATYRMRGRWRHLSYLNSSAVQGLCELVNSLGMAGIVLQGLEAADARLYRLLPECFGVARMDVDPA